MPQTQSPAVLLVTTPHPDVAALKACTADALVIQCADDGTLVSELAAARPDLPLVVLVRDFDSDSVLAHHLLTAGADEVLAAEAGLADVSRAVRHAVARRARRTVAAPDAAAPPDIPPQLQAIGRLAAGLGHEFNNLLLMIGANADLLRQRLPEGNVLREAADSISNASRRAASLTRQLLAFGRQQALVPAAVDLNTVVTETAPALRNAMGKYVRVATQLGRNLPQVRVDAEQMSEVLCSLAVAALEAMPSGGTFTISTGTVVIGEDECRNRPWLKPGPYVRVDVSDTGVGIEEQALPHLFEPFYAANGVARGSGLTMSSVYGVVKQSGGFIWVDSRMNKGTTVTILLPPIGVTMPLSASQPVQQQLPGGPPHVLLVEDIDGVRDVLKNLLELNEFRVTAVPTAEEALDLLPTEHFAILVTDVALPGRSGPELAREMRQRFPGKPVLFMSGHPMNATDAGSLEQPRAFLQKPFSALTLVERIRELLGQAAVARAER